MLCKWRRFSLTQSGLLVLGLLTGFAAAVFVPAAAQTTGGFLKGETVRIFVGFSPGGGYDAYARMLAPHFEKRTGATVIVDNRPGGGGLTALNQLVRTKPDGFTMMMLNGESALLGILTKQPGVAFDMTKVTNLARVAHEQHFVIVRPDMPDSLKEIISAGRKVKFSASGRVDNLGDYAAVLCEALQMNCQIIAGYKGSKEAGLAVMNGEVDALAISDGSGNDYAQGGRTKVIATIGHERSVFKPDIPTVYEMFQLAADRKWWLDFRLTIKAYGRVMVAPPDLPADRREYLQQVWRDILTDPEVIAEGERTQRPLSYLSPAKLNEIIRDLLHALPADRVKDVNEVILKKFS
jgi:tripartite-type tricarboxylate transporter receptor subunit TctC